VATQLSLQDVPRLRSSERADQGTLLDALHQVRTIPRRRFLRGATVAAVGAGIAFVDLFPAARRAKADHGVKYEIKALPCPTYPFYDNNPACMPCGPNTIYESACIYDTSAHYYGYHKENPNWDLRPNECVASQDLDGWIWRVDGTHCGIGGCMDWVKWRCHDGWKVVNGVRVDKSICAYVCDCDGLAINDCDPTP
jgi:hypothetical protein